METKQAPFVVHLIVEDPNGPIRSRKPKAANLDQLERDMRRVPGNVGGTLGNPGKRFAVACRQVNHLDGYVHRGSVDMKIVTCIACRKVAAEKESASGRES